MAHGSWLMAHSSWLMAILAQVHYMRTVQPLVYTYYGSAYYGHTYQVRTVQHIFDASRLPLRLHAYSVVAIGPECLVRVGRAHV